MQSQNNFSSHRGMKWLLALLLLMTACASETDPAKQVPPASTETPPPLMAATALPDTPTGTATRVPVPETEAVEPSSTPLVSLPVRVFKVCDPTIDVMDAVFVDDIGLVDGSHVPPAATFTKMWQVRNTGDCSWPEGTELVFIAGSPFPGPQRFLISQADPQQDITISVDLMAPAKPGAYESFWRLRTPDGRLFGAVLFVDIVVEEGAQVLLIEPTVTQTATARPTATTQPTRTPSLTPIATATPTPPPTMSPTVVSERETALPCGAPDDRFHAVINQATALDIQVLCAIGPIEKISGQVQLFRRNVTQDDPDRRLQSFMILREDTDRIYVLTGKDADTYEAIVATYSSAQGISSDEVPATCSGLGAPSGYILPTGRIGATWCDESLWNSLAGWPWEPAADATLEIQETTNGLLIRATTLAAGAQAARVYLVAIDFGARRATVD